MFHSLQFTAQAWQPTQMSRSMTRPSFLPGRGDGRLAMSLVAFDVIFGSPDLLAAAGRHAGPVPGSPVASSDSYVSLYGYRPLWLAGEQLEELPNHYHESQPGS